MFRETVELAGLLRPRAKTPPTAMLTSLWNLRGGGALCFSACELRTKERLEQLLDRKGDLIERRALRNNGSLQAFLKMKRSFMKRDGDMKAQRKK
jgi:hypothetical protein